MRGNILAVSAVLLIVAGCQDTDSADLIYNAEIKARYGIEAVYVKGGTFTMGCTPEQARDCLDNEKPTYRVTLGDFYIGKHEVTQAQWREIMGTDIRRQRDAVGDGVPLFFEWPLPGEGDDYPMYYVSWYDAVEFCNMLSELTGREPAYHIDKNPDNPDGADAAGEKWIVAMIPDSNGWRLPLEAEWEYAARGGGMSKGYKYSGGGDIEEVAWYAGNSESSTHPVGTKAVNESGIHDMSGNVQEWVFDRYLDGHLSEPSDGHDPVFSASAPLRVIRGGGWGFNAETARVSYRSGAQNPSARTGILGFRLARSAR